MASVLIQIGTHSSEHVALEVTRRTHPNSDDYYDGNWLSTDITVKVGAWRGKYDGSLTVPAFVGFRDQLSELYEKLSGKAIFSCLEPWIEIEIEGDGKGGMILSGLATDQLGSGNELKFSFELDQTFLPDIIKQLNELIEAYPVVGNHAG